jgi:hypothetical protein
MKARGFIDASCPKRTSLKRDPHLGMTRRSGTNFAQKAYRREIIGWRSTFPNHVRTLLVKRCLDEDGSKDEQELETLLDSTSQSPRSFRHD